MSLVNAIIDQNQFVLAPSLQMFFINPDNCQPLSAGTITFYRDKDRTITGLKPVYRIGGTPTDPTFIALPNPVTLDMCGIFIDNNNGDIILPYYDILDANGNIDLYYIEIRDSFGEVIETLEHFPQVNAQGENVFNQVTNVLPNGQFLAHLNLPNSGIIPQAVEITNIAYGGWQFIQTVNTSSVNTVTFVRFNAPTDNPEQNPRYAVRINSTVANPADSEKDISDLITDVNYLQGQNVTFQVTAFSNDGGNHNVSLVIYKNYGTGGSVPTTEVINTFTVTPEIQDFLISFTMSSNIGKTLGIGDDDFLRVILRSPTDTVSDMSFTDVMLVSGTFTTLIYPPTDPEQTKSFALPASFDLPAYDGSDSGKFIQVATNRKGELGFTYTTPALVPTGTLLPYSGTMAPFGYVLSDGTSYAVQTGGDLGVLPDLFTLILSSSVSGTYTFGTGINGFTYSLTNSPNPPAGPDQTYVFWNRFDIAQPAPNPGTSGFTFVIQQSVTPNVQQQIYLMTVVSGALITAGSYFTLPVNTTGPQFIQMFWFTVDGIGTQPVVTFNSVVKIDILSTDSATDVRDKVMRFANGLFQVPDMRNNYAQYWNHGSTGWELPATPNNQQPANRDPSENYRANAVTPSFVSYITGNSGDNIGSSAHGPTPTSSFGSGADSNSPFSLYFNAIMKT